LATGFVRLLTLAGFCFLVTLAAARAELKPIHPLTAVQVAQAPPSAFGPRPDAPGQPSGSPGGVSAWVFEQQHKLQGALATSVKRMKTDDPMSGALALAALSFLYGILHAIGPGHGKAIISSYVVANEETVRRGVLISFIAAGLQALTAIALVGVVLIGLNATGLQVNAWSNYLESVSYALIAAVGLYLLLTQLARLWRGWRKAPASRAGASHSHHDHDHGHQHRHDHDHGPQHHAHPHGEACDHCDHIVDARQLAGPFSWRKVLAVVFSVGIRPCTGAILVLVFAVTQGVFWAGVAATFAMALGTAITVAALATLALGSRELALKLGGANAAWANAVWTACTIGGALIIFLFGLFLFMASLGPARPF
jgi:ABC-type nickel/cobalt efflux system permease component RcnA